jgi:hypothetical protein
MVERKDPHLGREVVLGDGGTLLQWSTDDPRAAKCCLNLVEPPPLFCIPQILHSYHKLSYLRQQFYFYLYLTS